MILVSKVILIVFCYRVLELLVEKVFKSWFPDMDIVINGPAFKNGEKRIIVLAQKLGYSVCIDATATARKFTLIKRYDK